MCCTDILTRLFINFILQNCENNNDCLFNFPLVTIVLHSERAVPKMTDPYMSTKLGGSNDDEVAEEGGNKTCESDEVKAQGQNLNNSGGFYTIQPLSHTPTSVGVLRGSLMPVPGTLPV